MRRSIVLIAFIFATFGFLKAQTEDSVRYSLQQAVDYALENNYGIKNSTTDIEISRRQVKSITAIGLPQINATVDYNNFLELPTSLIPGDFFGQPGEMIPIQFGTEYNVTADITLTQLIFNGSYIIGLQAARSVVQLSETKLQRDKNELTEIITNAYFGVLVIKKTVDIIDSTLVTLEKMLFEIEETYKSGFVEDTDVDQIRLLVSDLQAARINIDQQVEIVTNLLKFQMGKSIDEPIILTDDLESHINNIDMEYFTTTEFDYTQHIDYRLIKDQEMLKTFNLKNKKAQYLPALMGYLSLSENAQRNSFNFFESGEDWFRTTLFGVSLSIPILSSGQRHHEVQRAKMELDQIKVLDEQVREGLKLEYATARSNFQNAIKVYTNKKQNVETADKIYNKTILKYGEGVSTSMDLLQSYNQYLDAQSTYIKAITDLLSAKSSLEKVLSKK